jgi:hypothetical protein
MSFQRSFSRIFFNSIHSPRANTGAPTFDARRRSPPSGTSRSLEKELGTAPFEPGSFIFSINPNLHQGRAVESIVNVEEGKEKYILEISPVRVGVRPDK